MPPTDAALTFVIFDPLIAEAVPVKFAAGKLVSDAPEPLNVVAVKVPFDELNVRSVSYTHLRAHET